ncbi:MAG TPA: putative glycoside hydrolase, partial [Marinagarivorans sp.]|nr:putative glycoside hydrolase [Marinagarivorans sp.]
HTLRIPVKNLVANGLELSRIHSAFNLQLFGQSKAGLHVQVNNVRWEYTASGSSSSSSSSSSSGQPVAFNCTADICDLFKDRAEPGHGVLADFEWKASGTGVYHYQSAADAHVQWQLVNSQDSAHGTVVEVTYNANDPSDAVNDNGWFGLAVGNAENTTADLSAYADGAISFDMRVIRNGQITDNFDVKMECIYPCTSEEFWVPDGANNGQWQTHTLPIKRMIETGLDIKKVNNLIIIKPGWGNQRGQYVVQLDNIRLLKNYVAPSVTSPVKPAENKTLYYFQNAVAAGSRVYIANTADGLGASFNQVVDGSSTVIDLVTNISNMGLFLFASGEFYQRQNLTDFYYGNVVFDLRVLNYSGNTSALSFTVNCGGRCRNVPSFTIGHPEAGSWITYRIPVKTLADNGVDLTRVTDSFMLTLTGSSQPGVHLQVNNIRWEVLSP